MVFTSLGRGVSRMGSILWGAGKDRQMADKETAQTTNSGFVGGQDEMKIPFDH